MSDGVLLTPGERLAQLAGDRPDDAAVVVARLDGSDQVLSFAELEARSNRLARLLAERGVDTDAFVGIVLPTCAEHTVATFAALKLGACPMPVSHLMPPAERDEMLALGDPVAVVSDALTIPGAISLDELSAPGYDDGPLETYPVPNPYKAVGSGGSTGRKKLIVSEGGWAFPVGGHPLIGLAGLREGDVQYSSGPLYHNQAFFNLLLANFAGATVVLNEKFSPATAFRLIREHGVTLVNTVPTCMLRMLRHDPEGRQDVSTIRTLMHMAAMCPEWVKRGWIDRLGPDAVLELWAATELTGVTVITGEEWVSHPGSVGRPWNTEVRILDDDGRPVPAGEVGNLWTRLAGTAPAYRYIGAEPLPTTEDGFATVGDLARVDEDGFVYLADRRVDMIVSGGANIFPAEIESVLLSAPRVRDAAVVGLPDDDLGRVPHAIIEPVDADDAPTEGDLRTICTENLVRYKVPRSFEFVAELPRDDAGKIRRLALRDAREGG